MERITVIAVAAALTAATFILPAAGAQPVQPKAVATASTNAPSAAVLFLDRASVQRLSAAGKDMRLQFDALMAKMQADFAPENLKLQADLEALRSRGSPTVPGSDDRRAKYNELLVRRDALQKRLQDRQDSIEAGLAQARGQLERGLKPILEKIMREREANLLLDRGLVIRGGGDLDITATVIQRLDAALPRIAVVPAKMPAGPTPGP